MTEPISDDPFPRFAARRVTRPRAQVEEQLRQAILSGAFGHGDRLPRESQLADEFGVSRSTVREALEALVSDGLIRRLPGPGGGSFVNSVTPDSLSEVVRESVGTILRLGALSLDELTGVRRALEVPAARLAAMHRSGEHLEHLWATVERQRTTTVDDPEIPTYDLAFHTTIGRASGNRLLAVFIASLHDATRPAGRLAVTPEVGRQTVRQHMAIAAAVEGGRSEDAAEAMVTHLEYVSRYSAPFPPDLS